jgi:pilus assembly protein Flp/PilA
MEGNKAMIRKAGAWLGIMDESGQGLAEYALILALIAVLAIAAVTFLGGKVDLILSNVGKSI